MRGQVITHPEFQSSIAFHEHSEGGICIYFLPSQSYTNINNALAGKRHLLEMSNLVTRAAHLVVLGSAKAELLVRLQGAP